MTYKEALLSSVGYPFSAVEIELACINRGLSPDGEYTAPSKAYDLAKADLYLVAVNKPNISEGGYSVTVSDKKNYLLLRKAIFDKYGIKDLFTSGFEPTISSIKPW
ncbi:MAG: hypothetical protein K0B15_12235 [Lentimicrobium sp.]|nr:hypothetical protein [Lentimicrobium sp.]